MKRFWMVMAIAGVASFGACDNSVKSNTRPKIELEPALTTVPVEEGSIAVGASWTYSVRVFNRGDATLSLLAKPALTPTLCTEDPATASPFTVAIEPAGDFPKEIAPAGNLGEAAEQVTLTVMYVRPATSSCERQVILTIPSNDPEVPEAKVTFKVEKGTPRVVPVPEALDVGQVPGLQAANRQLLLQNTGLGDFLIDHVEFTGVENEEGFTMTWPCAGDTTDKPVKPDARLDKTNCKNLSILANGILKVGVGYKNPLAEGEPLCSKAEIVIYGNDPRWDLAKGQGLVIPIQSNCGGPSLKVDPNPIDFGPLVVPDAKTLAVSLQAKSDAPVLVTSIRLDPEQAPGFTLKTDGLGAFSKDSPLEIKPTDAAGKHKFQLTCTATTASEDPVTKKPVPQTATVIIANNSAIEPEVKVPVTCLPVKNQGPVCGMRVFMPDKTELTDPATILPTPNFDPMGVGLRLEDTSYSPTPGVDLVKREWALVAAPLGNASIFEPSPALPKVTFAPNIVGEYTIQLTVWDAKDVSSICTFKVSVQPPKGCHVELTWDTPDDLDQTDSDGADLDLHVTHPYATGEKLDASGQPYGYFDLTWDCYWMNAHPTWDQTHASDPLYQPALDRDDQDGAGPENFTYTYPEQGKCYRVGVHYFDATAKSGTFAFGKSYPTVRVFIDSSTPVYEKMLTKGVKMLEMWDVGRVCCAEGKFEEFLNPNQTPVIVSNYVDPMGSP